MVDAHSLLIDMYIADAFIGNQGMPGGAMPGTFMLASDRTEVFVELVIE